jgi:hypothetical protein
VKWKHKKFLAEVDDACNESDAHLLEKLKSKIDAQKEGTTTCEKALANAKQAMNTQLKPQ